MSLGTLLWVSLPGLGRGTQRALPASSVLWLCDWNEGRLRALMVFGKSLFSQGRQELLVQENRRRCSNNTLLCRAKGRETNFTRVRKMKWVTPKVGLTYIQKPPRLAVTLPGKLRRDCSSDNYRKVCCRGDHTWKSLLGDRLSLDVSFYRALVW